MLEWNSMFVLDVWWVKKEGEAGVDVVKSITL